MNLEIIEPHPQWVLAAFRRGEFDGLEVIGEADARAFFELAIQEKMLERLAARHADGPQEGGGSPMV